MPVSRFTDFLTLMLNIADSYGSERMIFLLSALISRHCIISLLCSCKLFASGMTHIG